MGTEVKTCRLCQCFWEGVYATPAKERTSYRSWEEVMAHNAGVPVGVRLRAARSARERATRFYREKVTGRGGGGG